MALNPKTKKIISWLVYLAVLAGLVFSLPKALSYFLDTPYPMAVITSGSMWPALKQGDLVFIKRVSKAEIQVGDIVIYRNPHGLTVHRVIQIQDDMLVTKGDANTAKDAPISKDKVLGRVIGLQNKPLRIPYLGSISSILRQ